MDEKIPAYMPSCTVEEYLEFLRIQEKALEYLRRKNAERCKRLQQQYDEARKAVENYKKRIKDRESRET